jgi:RNA polymerase sigma factor (sigma-70 family)
LLFGGHGPSWSSAGRGGHTARSASVTINDGGKREDVTMPDATVDGDGWRADQFQAHRPHLRAVAYRMLGSLTDADDALQECWLRLQRAEVAGVADLRAWLTTVIGRICLDLLRARRSRREDYVGTWLPEPVVTPAEPGDLAEQAALADTVGLALLVVLETLTPAERLAFVLHDVFAVPFEDVAGIVGRSPAAARQLASRARRRIRLQAPDPDADLPVQRRVVDAFLAAARAGDFERLLAVLDPEVVLRTDVGGTGQPPRPPVVGARQVAAAITARGPGFARLARPAIVNGGAGLVVATARGPIGVIAFTVTSGRIVAIDLVANPAKLQLLQRDPAQPSGAPPTPSG